MSNLEHLLGRYSTHPAVKTIIDQLNTDQSKVRLQLSGLTGAQESFAVSATAKGLNAERIVFTWENCGKVEFRKDD